MIPVRYVDFPTLLGDLIARGYYTNAGLARELNCPDSTVRMWRAGHKPPHHYGEALVKTWEVATGQPAPEKLSESQHVATHAPG